MKKLLTLSLSAALLCGALTACGGNTATQNENTQSAEATTEAVSEAASEEASKAEATDGEITFETLQENYAAMKEAYDTVEAAYMDDSVQQDPAVEETLTEAKSLIDEIGELKEEDFKDASEMSEMNDNFVKILEVLSATVDSLQPAEADAATDTADASTEELDITEVSENFNTLVDSYNTIKDAVEAGQVTLDADQQAAMDTAADLINQLGEITTDSFKTQKDLDDTNSAISSVMDVLVAVAESL